MLSIVPRPVRAMILLFPDNEAVKTKHKEHDEKLAKEGQHPIDETLFFVQQTVCPPLSAFM
jgi:ubiquitin carboxyl-terminal hydrolase L3